MLGAMEKPFPGRMKEELFRGEGGWFSMGTTSITPNSTLPLAVPHSSHLHPLLTVVNCVKLLWGSVVMASESRREPVLPSAKSARPLIKKKKRLRLCMNTQTEIEIEIDRNR